MLKGTATIELTDVKTGQKEVVKHDNLVTNAINDLLTLNPDGYLWNAKYDFAGNLLPLCPNAIGGILLYQDPLEEDPTKYYAPDTNPLVGYSSNDVNSGLDVKRGSMNLSESGVLEDYSGYRFVFDFGTSQANGTISALGLTSKYGGVSGYGSLYDYKSAIVNLSQYKTSLAEADTRMEWLATKYETIVGMSDDGKYGYYAYVGGQNLIKVGRIKLCLDTLPLAYGTDVHMAALEKETDIGTQIFASTAEPSAYNYRYYNFMDDGAGYIWGFEHQNNASGNSASPATLNWIRISKNDFSFTEGTFSVNAALYRMGMVISGSTKSLSTHVQGYSIIHNGYLYCIKYDKTGVVKIDLENPADIKEILHPDGSVVISGVYNNDGSATEFNVLGNILYFGNGHIVNDEIVPHAYAYIDATNSYQATSKYPKGLCDGKTLGIQTGPFLVHYLAYYANSSNCYCTRTVSLMTPYLATINNLDTPVTKTADKTMKITYILREE